MELVGQSEGGSLALMKGDATGDAVVDKEEGVVVRQASDQMDIKARPAPNN